MPPNAKLNFLLKNKDTEIPNIFEILYVVIHRLIIYALPPPLFILDYLSHLDEKILNRIFLLMIGEKYKIL